MRSEDEDPLRSTWPGCCPQAGRRVTSAGPWPPRTPFPRLSCTHRLQNDHVRRALTSHQRLSFGQSPQVPFGVRRQRSFWSSQSVALCRWRPPVREPHPRPGSRGGRSAAAGAPEAPVGSTQAPRSPSASVILPSEAPGVRSKRQPVPCTTPEPPEPAGWGQQEGAGARLPP